MANEITKVTDQNGVDHPFKDAVAQAGVIANTKLIKDTVGWSGKNMANFVSGKGINSSGEVINTEGRIATVQPITIKSGMQYKYVSAVTENIPLCIYAVWNGSTLVRREAGIESGTILNTSGGDKLYVCVYGRSSTSVTIDSAKAMVIDANILDLTYEPYFGSTAFDWKSNTKTGVHQFLPMKIADIKAINTSGTWDGNAYTHNGIVFTFTVDSNGNVTEVDADGTSTADWATLYVNRYDDIKAGNYILSGCDGGDASSYRLAVDSTETTLYDGEMAVSSNTDFKASVKIIIRRSGYVANHIKFKPLIRLAEDTDASFSVHAMTNEELTDAVTPKTIPVTTDSRTLTKEGVYRYETIIPIGSSSDINLPTEIENKGVTIVVRRINVGLPTTNTLQQIAYINNQGYFFIRPCNANNWGSWYKFTGTVVS